MRGPSKLHTVGETDEAGGPRTYARLVDDSLRHVYRFHTPGGRGLTIAGWDAGCWKGEALRIRSDAKAAWAVDLMGNRTGGVCPHIRYRPCRTFPHADRNARQTSQNRPKSISQLSIFDRIHRIFRIAVFESAIRPRNPVNPVGKEKIP